MVRFKARIHINGNYIIGSYSTPTKAAVAYNKAVDLAKRHGIAKNFPENYVEELSAKEYDDVIICSVVKKVGDSIYDVIKDYTEEDVWEGGRIWRADMATGYIDMAYGDAQSVQLISDDLKAELAELSKKIVAGEIEVETALG